MTKKDRYQQNDMIRLENNLMDELLKDEKIEQDTNVTLMKSMEAIEDTNGELKSKRRNTFLQQETTDNIMWGAQQLISTHTNTHINQLERAIRLLDKVLYKSWAKEMTLRDLREIINMAKDNM